MSTLILPPLKRKTPPSEVEELVTILMEEYSQSDYALLFPPFQEGASSSAKRRALGDMHEASVLPSMMRRFASWKGIAVFNPPAYGFGPQDPEENGAYAFVKERGLYPSTDRIGTEDVLLIPGAPFTDETREQMQRVLDQIINAEERERRSVSDVVKEVILPGGEPYRLDEVLATAVEREMVFYARDAQEAFAAYPPAAAWALISTPDTLEHTIRMGRMSIAFSLRDHSPSAWTVFDQESGWYTLEARITRGGEERGGQRRIHLVTPRAVENALKAYSPALGMTEHPHPFPFYQAQSTLTAHELTVRMVKAMLREIKENGNDGEDLGLLFSAAMSDAGIGLLVEKNGSTRGVILV